MMMDEFEAGVTKYQLNLIFLLDTGSSMDGERINLLNIAMESALKLAENIAADQETVLSMRVIEFDSTAKWHIGDTCHGVTHIDWEPVKAYGTCNMADAIDLAETVMHRRCLGERFFRPVVILCADSISNDPGKTGEAVARLKSSLKSKDCSEKDNIIRIAIGMDSASLEELSNFASVGSIERKDGTIDEGVPFVFNVDDANNLPDIMRRATVGGINATINAGKNETLLMPVVYDEEADDDWDDYPESHQNDYENEYERMGPVYAPPEYFFGGWDKLDE